ncbi:MAG: SDR family oxidoreductase [Betaproteobacteria bacterium]|nr:SDR family oxidoreductase [Betaproteobacteria bacterium]
MVIGGSSGLGRALAERLACAGHSLVLVSSDLRDTQALAADLALRWGVQAVPMALDLAQSPLPLAALDAALAAMPPLTGLLLAAGMNREGDEPGANTRFVRGADLRQLHEPVPPGGPLSPPVAAGAEVVDCRLRQCRGDPRPNAQRGVQRGEAGTAELFREPPPLPGGVRRQGPVLCPRVSRHEPRLRAADVAAPGVAAAARGCRLPPEGERFRSVLLSPFLVPRVRTAATAALGGFSPTLILTEPRHARPRREPFLPGLQRRGDGAGRGRTGSPAAARVRDQLRDHHRRRRLSRPFGRDRR